MKSKMCICCFHENRLYYRIFTFGVELGLSGEQVPPFPRPASTARLPSRRTEAHPCLDSRETQDSTSHSESVNRQLCSTVHTSTKMSSLAQIEYSVVHESRSLEYLHMELRLVALADVFPQCRALPVPLSCPLVALRHTLSVENRKIRHRALES